MTALKKYRTALALFMVMGFLIGSLGLYVHDAFFVLFFVNLLFWSWRMKIVRCTQCECAVAPPVGSSALALFKSFKETTCSKCGAKLD